MEDSDRWIATTRDGGTIHVERYDGPHEVGDNGVKLVTEGRERVEEYWIVASTKEAAQRGVRDYWERSRE